MFRTLVILFLGFVFVANAFAENWPAWRGANNGHSNERGLPIVWDEDRSMIWKCSLPEWGTSTPAVWNDAIFVTCHVDKKLQLLRINAANGEIVWTKQVGEGEAPREAPKRERQKFHRLHNLATPSPVTNGTHVVVHFGNGDLATYDFDGNQIWRRNLQDDYGQYTIWWGHANSPVIHGINVISVCMQDSLADLRSKPVESYIVSHDIRDGHVRWKTVRDTGANAEQCDAYTTPLLQKRGDKTQLIVMGGNQLDAYNAADGKQLWYLSGLFGGRTVTGPTIGEDMVFTTRGMRGPLLAVRLGESGKLTRKSIAWDYRLGTPDSCTPILWANLLFFVADDGVARCIDVSTGGLKWKARLQGKYKASPVAAEGRVFFLNTEGLCTVISAAPRFDKLTENQLDDETIASPAIANGRIYIRGRKTLYCIGR